MYDTIIIGAGMSGLAAGIRLAYYDQRVCILERHYTIGGLNSFYRLRGRDYDVGLHALTNVTPKGTKTGPLARLLRQLRMKWDDFAIAPQLGSEIAFPDVRLRFDNNSRTLRDEVAYAFPHEADNFDRLANEIVAYDDLSETHSGISAREVVSSIIREPLLVEMLFCPLMFYGSAREHDMDWGQFSIMFRSIFLEGLGRPAAGVRLILKHLVRKFRALGGELKLRGAVKTLAVENDRVTRVVLENGEELEARNVVSSAGWCETMRMCDDGQPVETSRVPGQLTFCETIATLDKPPSDIGHEQTITFFNDHDKFVWQKPEGLCDVRSGVICSPNNFAYDSPLDDGTMRITALANFDRWRSLGEEAYRLEKLRWYDRIAEAAVRFVPDYRGHVIDTDMFTPTTIVRYSSHDNGAVYGAPEKQFDGRTHLKNLFICGTDQRLCRNHWQHYERDFDGQSALLEEHHFMSEPEQISRRFAWWLRFSLLNALLMMTIVGITIVTARLWREVEPLRQEVFRLRQELGYLTIKDENKIYAIQVSGPMPGVTRYRVYLPKGYNFLVNSRIHTVPGKALKQGRKEWLATLAGSGSSTSIKSGEFTIDVSVQPDPRKKDEWDLTYNISGKGSGTTGTVMPWLNDRRVWYTSSEASLGKQKEFNPEDGIVLFTLREAQIKQFNGGYSAIGPDESKETNGLMLWIAPEVKGH